MSPYALGCQCGHPLYLKDDPEHCLRCGHGPCVLPRLPTHNRRRTLPRDLGAFQREGRRPDPNLDNVVRLDRLRRSRRIMEVIGVRSIQEARLTRREVEVLRLVADGLSDREVAARLTISPQTVKFHLSHVLKKLNVRNRVLAARWHWQHVESQPQQTEMAA